MGHLLKLKYALGTLDCAYVSFNKCLIQTFDSANAKFSANWYETDYSANTLSNTSYHCLYCSLPFLFLTLSFLFSVARV